MYRRGTRPSQYARDQDQDQSSVTLLTKTVKIVKILSQDETVSQDLTSLISGRLQVYVDSVAFKKKNV